MVWNELLELFHFHRVEFVVVGAHALAYHGAPRFTGDLDILVHADDENAGRIIAALDDFGFANSGISREDFTRTDQIVQLGHSPARVDLLTSLTGVDWEAIDGGTVTDYLGPGASATLPVRTGAKCSTIKIL